MLRRRSLDAKKVRTHVPVRRGGLTALGFFAVILAGIILSILSQAFYAFFVAQKNIVQTSDTGLRISNDYLKLSQLKLLEQKEEVDSVQDLRGIQSFIARYSKLSATESRQLARIIIRQSKAANIDPYFVAAVIKSESNFRQNVVSPVGARGLMQILPTTGKYIATKVGEPWRGSQFLFDAEYNIRLGIAYLQYLERYFGTNYDHLLVAYNWGPTNTKKALAGNSTFPPMSRNYAKTILQDVERWSVQPVRMSRGARASAIAG
jgi:soluble lytic murein transglycosylase-like protein